MSGASVMLAKAFSSLHDDRPEKGEGEREPNPGGQEEVTDNGPSETSSGFSKRSLFGLGKSSRSSASTSPTTSPQASIEGGAFDAESSSSSASSFSSSSSSSSLSPLRKMTSSKRHSRKHDKESAGGGSNSSSSSNSNSSNSSDSDSSGNEVESSKWESMKRAVLGRNKDPYNDFMEEWAATSPITVELRSDGFYGAIEYCANADKTGQLKDKDKDKDKEVRGEEGLQKMRNKRWPLQIVPCSCSSSSLERHTKENGVREKPSLGSTDDDAISPTASGADDHSSNVNNGTHRPTLPKLDVHGDCPWLSKATADNMAWADAFTFRREGGVFFYDKEVLARQSGVVREVLSQFGASVLTGRTATTLSLPIRIFEPTSMLHRLARIWGCAPTILRRASFAKSPVERIKHVSAFVVSGLHLVLDQMKPFNPILGETCEMYMPDGTRLYIEHTSHRPPISSFLLEGPNGIFRLWGGHEYTGSYRGNSIHNWLAGTAHVDFPDGGRVTYQMPHCRMGGFLFGSRTIEWLGKIELIADEYEGQVQFDPEPGGWFSSRVLRSDECLGFIRNTKTEEVVSECEGSWLQDLRYDGVTYWDLRVEACFPELECPNPLPSDARHRKDLISLKKNDQVAAQKNKLELEALQRLDRKHRLDYQSKH